MTQPGAPIPQLPIFSPLTPAELVLVSRAAREVRYAKGQRLFSRVGRRTPAGSSTADVSRWTRSCPARAPW